MHHINRLHEQRIQSHQFDFECDVCRFQKDHSKITFKNANFISEMNL